MVSSQWNKDIPGAKSWLPKTFFLSCWAGCCLGHSQCLLQQQELRASMVLHRCCKWCNAESIRAVPTYFLGCWRQWGPKGHVRAALYLIKLQQMLPRESVAALRAQGRGAASLCIGLPWRGAHRATFSLWVTWEATQKFSRDPWASLCQWSTAAPGALSLPLKVKYHFGFLPSVTGMNKMLCPLLYSTGAALLSTISLGVAPRVLLWGGKHPGLSAAWAKGPPMEQTPRA